METEINPNVALKPPPLNSDQLNYLIWRYLQEAGYGDAAVKLQRDWKVEPENLPFAKHIKGQALVSLVQKGLRYHHLSLTIDESGRPVRQPNPSAFFFGPESGRPVSSGSSKESSYRPNEIQRALSPSNNTSMTSKKREPDSNGPLESAKRNRKTGQTNMVDRNGNGIRKTSTSANDSMLSMDIDHVNGSMRSPSFGGNPQDDSTLNGTNIDTRMDVDIDPATPGVTGMDPMIQDLPETFPPLVHTLTNGESIGIQVAPAKVASLGPSSKIIPLPEAVRVTKAVWRPLDASVLTVAGDHFCGAWRNPSSNTSDESWKTNYQDLLESSNTKLITAVAWEPNGGLLAMATYADQTGLIHLLDGRELMLIENLPASQRAITSLKWLPSPLRLVGIAPYDERTPNLALSSTILLWNFSDMQFSQPPLTLTVPEGLLDVDVIHHTSQDVICAVGELAVYYCRVRDEVVVEEKKWPRALARELSKSVNWAFIKCARRSDETVIVTASAENAEIWLPTLDIAKSHAHEGSITGLELRPRVLSSLDSTHVPDFATSSMDGTVKVWRLDPDMSSIEVVHNLNFGQASPIMSLAFSPDGFCLAGASYGVAHIWNAEHGYNLMASWEGAPEQWRGSALRDEDAMSIGGVSSVNGDNAPASADHTLAWDTDSKKLAFGLGSQVAIIDFQR